MLGVSYLTEGPKRLSHSQSHCFRLGHLPLVRARGSVRDVSFDCRNAGTSLTNSTSTKEVPELVRGYVCDSVIERLSIVPVACTCSLID